jgi:hypothetical protein
MEITINVYPQIQNVEITTEPNLTTINIVNQSGGIPINNITQIPNRSYDDLQDLPSEITNITQIATRSYNDLQNLPTIPSEITNITQIATRSYNDLQNLPFVEIIQNNLVSTTDTTTEVLLRTIPIGDLSTFRRLEYNTFVLKGPNNTGNATYLLELHNITTNTTTTLGSHSNASRYIPFSRTNIVISGGVLYYPASNILIDTGTSSNQVSTLNITSGDLYELRFSAASGAGNNLQNTFFYLKLTK